MAGPLFHLPSKLDRRVWEEPSSGSTGCHVCSLPMSYKKSYIYLLQTPHQIMIVDLGDTLHSWGWRPTFAGIIYKTIPYCPFEGGTITLSDWLYTKDHWITWLPAHCYTFFVIPYSKEICGITHQWIKHFVRSYMMGGDIIGKINTYAKHMSTPVYINPAPSSMF